MITDGTINNEIGSTKRSSIALLEERQQSVPTTYCDIMQTADFDSEHHLMNDAIFKRLMRERSSDTRNSDVDDGVLAESRLAFRQRLLNADEDVIRSAAHIITAEDRMRLKELEEFAQMFKMRRINFGFTQGDVGMALGQQYGIDFSQTTVSRFESLNLSFKNMSKLYPMLRQWLNDIERALANGATVDELLQQYNSNTPSDNYHNTNASDSRMQTSCDAVIASKMESSFEGASSSVNNAFASRKRRKRTNLEAEQRSALYSYFELCPHPDNDTISQIAITLSLTSEVSSYE